jgi:TolA-binding protein
MARHPLLWLPLVVGFSTGCFAVTTKHEGEELRRDVDRIDQTLEEKVQRLEQVLSEATDLLKRNSADLGAQVGDLTKEQARVTGLVEEVRQGLRQILDKQAQLEARLVALETKSAAAPPVTNNAPLPRSESADELFQTAKSAYESGKFEAATAEFQKFLARHPDHKLADDAQFMRAEAFFKADQKKTAIGEFQRVYEKFPKSELADQALFRAGEAAEQIKWCTDARAYYALLRQKYPKSDLAKKARTKDADLKAAAANPKKCKN